MNIIIIAVAVTAGAILGGTAIYVYQEKCRQKKKSSNYQAGTVLTQKIMEEAKQSDMYQKRN